MKKSQIYEGQAETEIVNIWWDRKRENTANRRVREIDRQIQRLTNMGK